jgi:hypothetical protein
MFMSGGPMLEEEEIEAIKRKIRDLEIEHRDLDEIIGRLSSDAMQDEIQLKRLKKRKLYLKDHITLLERRLVPDIPA